MQTYYFCDENNMKDLRTELSSIQSELQEAYDDLKKVYDDIASQEDWKGDSQKVTQAFMDLVLQYHDALCNGQSPLTEADGHFADFEAAYASFFDNFEAYKTLKEVKY